MDSASRDELLEQARALDARAFHAGVEERGVLLREAAELRVRALGPKPYPVLICDECHALTGWLTSGGLCAGDEQRRLERASGGFYDRRDLRMPFVDDEQSGTWRRLRGAVGGGRERVRAQAWLRRVEPDETGPIEPEQGWQLEAPVKHERPAPGGPGFLVCFDVQSVEFDRCGWRAIETTAGGKPATLVPRELAASLAIEALAEAWNDFEEEVAAHNRRVWSRERERREAQRRADLDARDAARAERGTSSLL